MWLERFEIVIVSLSRDFLPSSWHIWAPTYVDIGLFAGTFGFFGLLFLLFLRVGAVHSRWPSSRSMRVARRQGRRRRR